MRIHVAARNSEYAAQFSKHNPNLTDVVIHEGTQSLFALLQCIIDGDDDIALFLHDDVFVPSNYDESLKKLTAELKEKWPNWGICGNAGIVIPTLIGKTRACRYLIDPHGGPSMGGYVLPAETVDGNSILINCKALREAKLKLPPFDGFQFYDIALSIETLCAGFAVLVVPQLACFHNSKGNQLEFDKAFQQPALKAYLSAKLLGSSFTTLNGDLQLDADEQVSNSIKIYDVAILNAAKGRPDASIAFVICASTEQHSYLEQTVKSVSDFSISAQNPNIQIYVNGDKRDFDSQNIQYDVSIENIGEDFVLFIDDEKVISSHEAFIISKLLTCLPPTANLIFNNPVGSGKTTAETLIGSYWHLCLAGTDQPQPHLTVMYSRLTLNYGLFRVFSTANQFSQWPKLAALMQRESIVFSTPHIILSAQKLYPHPDAKLNNANEQVGQSKAEAASLLCADQKINPAWALGREYATLTLDSRQKTQQYPTSDLSKIGHKVLVFTRLIQGGTKFLLSPKNYGYNYRRYAAHLRNGGMRAFVRAIADTRLQ